MGCLVYKTPMLLSTKVPSFPMIFLVTLLAHSGILLIKGAEYTAEPEQLQPIQLTAFRSLLNTPFVAGMPSEKPASPKPVAAKSKAAKIVSEEAMVKDTVTTQEAALSSTPAAGSGGVASSISAAGSMAQGDLRSIYLSELRARLEEIKHYPLQARRLGQTGSVEVAFKVYPDGLIDDARIVRPSPFKRLNESALATVATLKKFRPLPEGMTQGDSLLVTLPIRYSIRN